MATSINVGVNLLRAVLSAVVLVTSSSTHALKMDKVSSESSEGTSVIRSKRSNAGVNLTRERFEESQLLEKQRNPRKNGSSKATTKMNCPIISKLSFSRTKCLIIKTFFFIVYVRAESVCFQEKRW